MHSLNYQHQGDTMLTTTDNDSRPHSLYVKMFKIMQIICLYGHIQYGNLSTIYSPHISVKNNDPFGIEAVGVEGFTPTWALVVTWVNIAPYLSWSCRNYNARSAYYGYHNWYHQYCLGLAQEADVSTCNKDVYFLILILILFYEWMDRNHPPDWCINGCKF